MAITQQRARDLAVDILLHLANDPEELTQFLSVSGLQPADLRSLQDRPEVALFLLDFLAEDDRRICDFAAALNMRPQDIMAARTVLSGPGSYGWTAD
ncbi:DUF3572 domain-containing protein [Paracoccus sp. T5]|uniref:DUF3572 domain-containing protein n=1 Tax=Paracoccus sp. T5 TaxID=3402161 RepID=UPI003AE91FE3